MHRSTPTSWFDVIQEQLKNYPIWLIELALYGFLALIVGFLSKNFGRYVLFALTGLIIAGWLFAYIDIITIHIDHIKELFGLTQAKTIDDAIHIYTNLARIHWAACTGMIIGFFIGWKYCS